MIPDNLNKAFSERVREALKTFPNTIGQCVPLCAYLSARLTEDGIYNQVALGSLSCNGIKTFQYKKMISLTSSAQNFWDGHAWLEFPGGFIGEASLFRTAKAAPPHSNLRRSLEALGIINRGAILFTSDDALGSFGLKYRKKAYLKSDAFMPLIGGLFAINGIMP